MKSKKRKKISPRSVGFYQLRFGTELRRLRKARGISLREVSRRARISATYLSRIERNESPAPPVATIRQLASVLETDQEELIRVSRRIPDDLIDIVLRAPWEYFMVLMELSDLTYAELMDDVVPAVRNLASQIKAQRQSKTDHESAVPL